MIRRFARPYARAVMDVVKSPEGASALLGELKRFEQARSGSAELTALYANPAQDMAAKLGVTRAVAAKLGASELAAKILDLLVRNHRINDLGAINAALAAMIREATGTVAAEVRAATQPTPAELEELRRTLEKRTGRKVEVDVTVDPALLGGFVAKVGSEVYDASVAGKINRFRESLG